MINFDNFDDDDRKPIKWTLNGKLHREDGPAFEWPNGDREWYLNGELVGVDNG